jgi:hypothetical protein
MVFLWGDRLYEVAFKRTWRIAGIGPFATVMTSAQVKALDGLAFSTLRIVCRELRGQHLSLLSVQSAIPDVAFA